MVDRYEALERLSRLKAEGVLTEEEFAAEKAKLLAQADQALAPAQIEAGGVAPPSRLRWLWLGLAALVVVIVGVALSTRPAATPAATEQASGDRIPACNSAEAKQTLTT